MKRLLLAVALACGIAGGIWLVLPEKGHECNPLLQLAGRSDLHFQCVMERRRKR